MSHQDQDGNRAAGSHADDLYKVFGWLTTKNAFQNLRFRRDCTWSPRILAFGALLWAWSDYRCLTERFQHVLKIIKHRFGRQHEPAENYQPFIKLLRKWTAPLRECLTRVFREKMAATLTGAWTVGEWLVFAADGSRIGVPRTRRNEERYSPRSKLSRAAQKRRRSKRRSRAQRDRRAREQKANVPQIWLTTVWHVASGLPWAWRTGPADNSERHDLKEMLPELPRNSLLTADAGFVGYDLWKAIFEAKLHLLVRVGGNVKLLKKLGYVRERGNVVYLWTNRAAEKKEPPLVLRLIVIRDGRRPVYLVSDLKATQLSDRQAAEVYGRRWGIELFYRHCKQTFERAKLRSQNPDNALVELDWSLLGMWAMGLYAHARLVKQGISPRKISFAGVLRAYREAMRDYRWQPAANERLKARLDAALIDDYERTNKTSRDYPRKKHESAAGPPIIRLATAVQRRNAKQVKEIQQKRLTA
jgi:hypothetical protein